MNPGQYCDEFRIILAFNIVNKKAGPKKSGPA